MKKITKSSFTLIISMLMVIALTSCEKEEPAVGKEELYVETSQKDPSAELIPVTGETFSSGTTKTTLQGLETHWIGVDHPSLDPDQVGINSPQALPESEIAAGVVNAVFTALTSGKSSEFEGEMYWGTGNHDFYAYYPYAAGSATSTEVPVALADEQNQSEGDNSDHIGALDFMVATPVTGIEPGYEGEGTSGVNFIYNHVFTLLEYQITGTGELTRVKLSASGTLAFNGGTIDITQGTPDSGVAYTIAGITGESGEVTVELGSPVELGVEPVSVYMMINPGDHSGNMAIGLEIDGDYTFMTKSSPEGGFVRGKKYEVPLVAGDFANTVTFTYRVGEVTYGIVLGAKGRLWMDRNLGASRVAEAYNDSEAYGDLFQWGRLDDGHQNRSSAITDELSEDDIPGHDKFIRNNVTSPYDWRDPQKDELWQGDGSINDVCPAGWRVPTYTELDEERESWSSNDYNGAFASPLKLVAGGFRNLDSGVYQEGDFGFYWSSTISTSNAYDLYFTDATVGIQGHNRARGSCVRCIKDD